MTIAYDSAEWASTITRPDSTTQTFFPNQEQGWTNSGTSGSPAAAALLATASSVYTDPNGNVTNQLPDWNGQGLTDVSIDALGNVSSYDRTSNGLATVAIDGVNRITSTATIPRAISPSTPMPISLPRSTATIASRRSPAIRMKMVIRTHIRTTVTATCWSAKTRWAT